MKNVRLCWLLVAVMVVLFSGLQVRGAEPRVKVDTFEASGPSWDYIDGREFPGAKGSAALDRTTAHGGKNSYKLSADFSGGGMYVGLYRYLGDLNGQDIKAIRLWLKSDNVAAVGIRLIDSTDQCHQSLVKLKPTPDWQEVVLNIADLSTGEHWGGANDGKWHGPLKGLGLNIGKTALAQPGSTRGSINIDDVAYLPGHVAQGQPTLLSVTISPRAVRPGEESKITYTWDAQPLGRDMSVFVHALAGDGKVVFQGDYAPPVATSVWSGKVEYTQVLYVPIDTPGGDYHLRVGLYDKQGRQALKTGPDVKPATGADAADAYDVGTLQVAADAPVPPLPKPTLDLTGYVMTFDEEFNSLSISAAGPGTRWFTATKETFGDAQFMPQKDGFPFSLQEGILPNKKVLRIEAAKRDGRWEGGIIASVDPKGQGFAQKFGYFEMRAKMPKSRGMWPAFWLLGQPAVVQRNLANPEIDVVEYYGGALPNMDICTLHVWNETNTGRHWAQGYHLIVPGLSDGFHRYGVMVDNDYVTFYCDGIEVGRHATPADAKVPLYMLVNLAMGGGWPIDKAVSPSYMYVDYIRVYAQKK